MGNRIDREAIAALERAFREGLDDACSAAQGAVRDAIGTEDRIACHLADHYLDEYTAFEDELADTFTYALELACDAGAIHRLLRDPAALAGLMESFVARTALSHAAADLDLVGDRFREMLTCDDTVGIALSCIEREDPGSRLDELEKQCGETHPPTLEAVSDRPVR